MPIRFLCYCPKCGASIEAAYVGQKCKDCRAVRKGSKMEDKRQ